MAGLERTVTKAHVQQKPVRDFTDLIRSGQWGEVVSVFEKLHPSGAAAILECLPVRQQRTTLKVPAIDDAALVVVKDTDSLQDVLASFEKYESGF